MSLVLAPQTAGLQRNIQLLITVMFVWCVLQPIFASAGGFPRLLYIPGAPTQSAKPLAQLLLCQQATWLIVQQ